MVKVSTVAAAKALGIPAEHIGAGPFPVEFHRWISPSGQQLGVTIYTDAGRAAVLMEDGTSLWGSWDGDVILFDGSRSVLRVGEDFVDSIDVSLSIRSSDQMQKQVRDQIFGFLVDKYPMTEIAVGVSNLGARQIKVSPAWLLPAILNIANGVFAAFEERSG